MSVYTVTRPGLYEQTLAATTPEEAASAVLLAWPNAILRPVEVDRWQIRTGRRVLATLTKESR